VPFPNRIHQFVDGLLKHVGIEVLLLEDTEDRLALILVGNFLIYVAHSSQEGVREERDELDRELSMPKRESPVQEKAVGSKRLYLHADLSSRGIFEQIKDSLEAAALPELVERVRDGSEAAKEERSLCGK